MKADGTMDKYKARLAIKGFRQQEGVYYFDTYSTRITSIKMILAIAALRNWEVHQMDVKMTFLNGDLEKVLYMNQLEGFTDPRLESKVCRHVKSLYSLRKASKQGHQCSPYHCQGEACVSVYYCLRKQRLSSRTSRLLRSRRLSASHKGRPNGHPFDPYAVYSKFPSVFSLEIHHGGKLSEAPNRLYDGGEVNWFDQIDSDGFSVVEVNQMLKCLGYLNPKMEYWYKMPDKDALLSLSNDNDVLRFIKYVDRYKLMQLYVVHPVDKPKPLGDNEVTEETFDPLFCDLDPETSEVPSEVPNVTEPSEVPNVTEPSEVPNVTEPSEVPNGPEPSEIPNDAEHSDGSDESEDSDDSDFDVELEDMIEDVEVDMDDFRKYTDENVEWVGRNEVPVEDTQPVDTEVFEDLDLEDFDSASDPDDIECNRKKALRMLAKKHKPVDGNITVKIFIVAKLFLTKN
ncbi:transposase, MuDR [Tanacetum coccineum]